MNLRRYLSSIVVAGFLLMGAGTQGNATITEDDPRWDCRTMGNRQCGDVIFFRYADGSLHAFDVNAPDRPGCFVEPSNTADGYEVIFYPDMAERTETLGFEVPCPKG